MSKRNQRRQPAKRKSKPVLAPPAESPTSRGVTVFWMMTVLATVMAEVVALAMRLLWWTSTSPTVLFFSNLMLLIAAVTGLICLVTTPLVLRWRDTPPPKPITRFAVVISLLPIVTLAAMLIWGH